MKQVCKQGHDTFIVGRTVNSTCKQCAINRAIKWQKANYQKHMLHVKNYQTKHPEKVSQWYRENTELSKAKSRLWAQKNPIKCTSATRKWQKANPLKVKETKAAWRKVNRGSVATSKIKQTTNRNLRVPKFGQDGIKDFYNNCPEGYEVDHIIPLQGKTVSGLHVIWNLQYLTKEDNRRKSNVVYYGVTR